MGVLNVSPVRRLHSVIKLSSPQRWLLISTMPSVLEFSVFYSLLGGCDVQHLRLLHCHDTVVNHVTCTTALLRLPQQQNKDCFILLTPITVFIATHLKVIGVSIMHISFLFCNLNVCSIKVNLKSINWKATVLTPQGNSTRPTKNRDFMPKSSKV